MRSLLLFALLAPLAAAAVESTPQSAVSALWAAMSNEPGGSADIATLKRLFHEEAVVFGGRYKEGLPVLRRWSGQEFLGFYQGVQQKGFHECEVHRVVQAYGRFAVVYSVVESRTDKAAVMPDFVGVNSVQLYKVGEQWQVLSLYYHVEKQGLPIPLEGGRQGECVG